MAGTMGRYVFLTCCRKSCASCWGTQHFPALSAAGLWLWGPAADCSNVPCFERFLNFNRIGSIWCPGRPGRCEPWPGALQRCWVLVRGPASSLQGQGRTVCAENNAELCSYYLLPVVGATLSLLAGAEPTASTQRYCCC